MKKSRIYVDTSIIGGCCDPEFQEWSNGLLLDFQKGTFLLLLSERQCNMNSANMKKGIILNRLNKPRNVGGKENYTHEEKFIKEVKKSH